MGSTIRLNAVLKLPFENNLPNKFEVGEKIQFILDKERIFQFFPILIPLVIEINGKWKFVGQIHVMRQTIDAEFHTTSGEFIIRKVYSDDEARIISNCEAPKGKSFYLKAS